jgi:hypothetical protein
VGLEDGADLRRDGAREQRLHWKLDQGQGEVTAGEVAGRWLVRTLVRAAL